MSCVNRIKLSEAFAHLKLDSAPFMLNQAVPMVTATRLMFVPTSNHFFERKVVDGQLMLFQKVQGLL
jgi:hypothetical protein